MSWFFGLLESRPLNIVPASLPVRIGAYNTGSPMGQYEGLTFFNNILYLINNVTIPTMLRVNANDMSLISSHVLVLDDGSSSLTNNGVNIYAGTTSTFARIVVIRMSDMVRLGRFNIGGTAAFRVANDGTHLYAGSINSPSQVRKVRLSDIVELSNIRLNTGEQITRDVLNHTDFVFVVTSSGHLVQCNKEPFARIAGFGLGGAGDPRLIAATATHCYVAITAGANTSIIHEYSINPFQLSHSFLNLPHGITRCVVIGEFLYGLAHTNPVRITKIHIPTKTVIGSIILNTGEAGVTMAVVDHSHIYLITHNAPQQLVKILG